MSAPLALVVDHETADTSEPTILMEQVVVMPTFFTGIRTYVVNGVAHLLFYAEHPTTAGDVEHVVVTRLLAPVAVAKAAVEQVAHSFRRPTSAYAPPGALN